MNLPIFTKTCTSCKKRIFNDSQIFCLECSANLPKTHYQLSSNNPVYEKFKGLVKLKAAGAFLIYHKNEMVQQLLWEIKYNQNQELCRELGYIMGIENKNTIQKLGIDIMLPIPLHPERLRLRGYNQSSLLCEGIQDASSIEFHHQLLRRKKNTLSQTLFHREKRFENVAHVFEINNLNIIQGKSILLVDDVITTGATLESAARTILNAGAKDLSILTLATAFEF